MSETTNHQGAGLMTLYNVGDVALLNVTSGISPDPDW